MGNVLGLGVFGTFGQPYGFQQAFNADVQFVHSLDLENDEIELFPNTELFAVKREIVRGVYSMCFCIYSYTREMNASSNTTFLGSCIVLQQVYIDADQIYKLLHELHSDLINNTQNVNSSIQVRQVTNLVVREPADFQLTKLGAKPLADTPYYSTKVDPDKKYFVQSEHIESAGQVVAFFDEALKNYNDVECIYFTFSDKVINAANKKSRLDIIDWEEFVNHKNVSQQDVVTTKKGLKPSPINLGFVPISNKVVMEQPAEDTWPQQTEPAESRDAKEEAIVHDPDFPFDGWAEPKSVWTIDETLKKVHEYNRLLAYAKHLKLHNDDLDELLNEKQRLIDNDVLEKELPHAPLERKKTVQDDIIAQAIVKNLQETNVGETEDEDREEKKPFYKSRFFPLIALGVIVIILICGFLVFKKHIFKKPLPNSNDTTQTVTTDHAVDTEKAGADTVSVDTVDEDKTGNINNKGNNNTLNPEANYELPGKEVLMFSKTGMKGRSLPDITNMIFQKFPDDVGSIYKQQFSAYSMHLLAANRNIFREKGADFVCISDTILHIPAYKSKRVPVGFPK